MFDIGANLTSSHFSDDLDSVLDESFEAGVKKICITSSSLQDVRNAKKLLRKIKTSTIPLAFIHIMQKILKLNF